MSEFVKEKWEPQISDDCAYIVANKGKFLIAEVYGIGAEESEKAEARVHLIAAAPATAAHRDKLLAACKALVEDGEYMEQDEGIIACQCLAEAPDDIVEPPKCGYCLAKAAIEGK